MKKLMMLVAVVGMMFGMSAVAQDVAGDILVPGDSLQDGAQRADSDWFVCGNRDAMVARCFAIQDYVAARLVGLTILPLFTQMIRKVAAVDIARNSHATARTSSLRKCKRTCVGFSPSK